MYAVVPETNKTAYETTDINGKVRTKKRFIRNFRVQLFDFFAMSISD